LSPSPKKSKVVLLSGGNPQIAKGDGNKAVQAYLSAMPGWKKAVGLRLDQLIEAQMPQVRKAVRWNCPFYGTQELGWLVSLYVLTRSVKVTFFSGASLQPMPKGSGKDPRARWIFIEENDVLDEKQITQWLKQAATLPGWASFSS
jgi:hypothetical protein